MKFRVKPKDLTIFIIFCIFLLIMSSLAVLNVTSLLDSTEFYGINFLAGFVPPYLLPTLIVFFAVLIAIFMSVSSYIFERDSSSKGIGITVKDKEEKGYSRWLKESEMKKAHGIVKVPIKSETADGAGIVVINDGKDMYVDNEHHHTLVVGQTGSGKSTALVEPLIYSLSKHDESMIITDPKGELYRNHSEMLRAKGYKIFVLNFREPSMGNAWNPLTLPYQLYKAGNYDKAVELLEDIALNIIYDPENKNDPFWEKSAADYFSGLALGLFEDAKEEQINISSINYMSTVGEESFATSNYVKEYFTLKGEESSPYIFASNTITAPGETKGGILSVFRQKIRQFSTRENLSEMLSYSDFNMRDIGNGKTAVFMIVQDEKTTYHPLATMFIKQCYETLIDVAQHEPNGRLKFRTNFILDEFANMPPLKDVTTMVTAARSRSIRFTFIVQNFAQLNEVYGKEDAETIRSNCGNLIYLLTTELAALEEISKLCGEVKSKEKDKTASTPLITVSDLQKLKMNEVIILHSRLNPFRTKLTPSYDIDWGDDAKFGKGELKEREKRPIELFDIKEFVKIKKRNKLFEALDGNKNEKKSNTPVFENPTTSNIIEPPKGLLNDDVDIEEPNLNNIFNPFNASKEPVKEVENDNDNDGNSGLTGFADLIANLAKSDNSTNNIDNNKVNDTTTPMFDLKSVDNKPIEVNVENKTAAPEFDIDSIVKRIDAKIAELEEQEKQEKIKNGEYNENIQETKQDDIKPSDNLNISDDSNNTVDYETLDKTIVEKFDDFMKEIDETTKDEPVVNVDKDSVIVGDVTDDQYYDDFFGDDDN